MVDGKARNLPIRPRRDIQGKQSEYRLLANLIF